MYGTGFFLLPMLVVCEAINTKELKTLENTISQNIFKGKGRNVPLALRLVFHDCIGPAGCDGCLNFKFAEHEGLGGIYELEKAVYFDKLDDEQRGVISFADWLALIGFRAVEVALRDSYNEDASFEFKTGRNHTDTCDGNYNQDQLPNALGGYNETITFLIDQFNISERESIVLLGAHSVGHCDPNNSGFSGPWTENPNVLDNEYYKVLVRAATEHWEQTQPRRNKEGALQWKKPTTSMRTRGMKEVAGDLLHAFRREETTNAPLALPLADILSILREIIPHVHTEKRLMMLNSDMCLYKEIGVDSDGESTCDNDVSSCDYSDGFQVVEELVANNTLFVEDFLRVFTKMIEKIPDGAKPLEPVTIFTPRDQKPIRRTLNENVLNRFFRDLLDMF